VQAELSEVRLLLELLGFLFECERICRREQIGHSPDMVGGSGYNVGRDSIFLVIIFLVILRRMRWNVRRVQCGRAD
jgi:hypothetical protein